MPAKNLILISLDTFRADVAYRSPLPCLERLCGSGTVFENTVSSAPVTPVSHASVFTALQPYEHGLRHLLRERLSTRKPTLAELMAKAGYETGAILACPGLNRWYGMDRGFSHYDDQVPRLRDGRDPLQVNDVKIRGTALKRAPLVVERSLAWLEQNRKKPFFLFTHFFDTHWPYEAPEWFAPEHANPYEGEAHYVDHYLGKLIRQIEEWGLLENTLLVIFSDHGEDLAGWYSNDHAGMERGYPEENGHGCLLFDATQMVPLIFIDRHLVPSGLRVSTQVRLVDILPTITELIQIEDPAPRAGESLVSLFSGNGKHRVAYSETYYREEQALTKEGVPGLGPWHAVRLENQVKLIVDVQTGSINVYDLASDQDEHHPIEFHNNLFGAGRKFDALLQVAAG
jgi:arylsulfatase